MWRLLRRQQEFNLLNLTLIPRDLHWKCVVYGETINQCRATWVRLLGVECSNRLKMRLMGLLTRSSKAHNNKLWAKSEHLANKKKTSLRRMNRLNLMRSAHNTEFNWSLLSKNQKPLPGESPIPKKLKHKTRRPEKRKKWSETLSSFKQKRRITREPPQR